MHSIPLEEDEAPFMGEQPAPAQAEVEVLGDLRGHRLAGRYVLVELLGSGELGCVYAGRDDATGQAVTVKVLALAEHRDLVLRIAERARQRFGLRHPALAALLAEGNVGGLWYAVMEDAPGKNCYHVQGDPRLEGAGLQAFALLLAEGLVALHGAGAVHGAVSPGNVVWGEAGPRLVDLDLSLSEQPGSPEPGPEGDVRALAGLLLELVQDAPAFAERLAAIARGEARPSAAEWAAELRRAATPPAPALFEEPIAAPVVPPPVVPPPVVPPPVVPSPAEVGAAEPTTSESAESIPEISGSQLVSETGSHAHVPEAIPPEPPRAAASDAAAAPAGEPAFGRASFEPVRAAIVGDEDDEDWAAAAPRPRRRSALGLVVGVVAVVVLAVIGWQLQRAASAPADPPPAPAEVVPAKRADLSPETSTLATVAAPPSVAAPGAAPVAAPPAAASPEGASAPTDVAPGTAPPVAVGTAPPIAEPAAAPTEPAEEEEEAGPAGSIEQLSAGEFRKILLRANRSPAARTCYRVHWQESGDVDLIATVGTRGTVRKLRMDEGELAGCLRKIVLGLEFPPAMRSAQHNFTFHRPPEGE